MDDPTGNATSTPEPIDRESFDRLLARLRPKVHRYCARMVGSVIEGEDVVQEALLKAIEALSEDDVHHQRGGLALSHRAQHGGGFPAPNGAAAEAQQR
jgi:hypothetical protein